RLGGAERLAWLMESADREVGVFAVRLLWEKHRPSHLPEGWKPAGATEAPAVGGTERFANVEALRTFLRRIIELVRDLGLEEQSFARVVFGPNP
ncbi:hypothetical protein, partial [Hyalangium sp.]|uniref:hypothetical protein n=1 Tax=Hyalangium sp. TaxID=2028555 RepID=UPI002D6EDA4D